MYPSFSPYLRSVNIPINQINITKDIIHHIYIQNMSSSSAFAPDHLHHLSPPPHLSPSEQLCYVQCNFCETVLAVSVPCTSLFRMVTVRCGHCANLLSVNMGGMVLPTPNQIHLGPSHFSPRNLLEESSNLLMNHHQPNPKDIMMPIRGVDEFIPSPPPVANKPPEKRQRVPSAYNRFIKDEIQRIKASNPDITHREAFSAAAKNWAHFPHIHFGLIPDQSLKKSNLNLYQQEGDDVLMKDNGYGFLAPANVGLSPY